MRYLGFTSLLYASLSIFPRVSASPSDGIDASTFETFGGAWCVSTYGAGSFVALYTDPNGHDICQCYNPNDVYPLSDFTACGGDAVAACTNEIDYVSGQEYHSDACDTCVGALCNDYIFQDQAFESACTVPGQHLYTAGGYCECGTAAGLSGPFGNTPVTRCTPVPNGYAVCNDATTVVGDYVTITQDAACSFGCNAGYTISSDGTGCVMGGSQLPRAKAKAKTKAKRWQAKVAEAELSRKRLF